MKFRCLVATITVTSLLSGLGRSATADDLVFDIQEIASRGRTVAAEFADFNGDRRKDLMVVYLEGIPPGESRTIGIFLQQKDSSFPDVPSYTVALPRSSAVYDVADLRDTPGDELILLRPDGVTILSLADTSGTQWDLPVDGPSTVAAAEDERGFDPFHLVYEEFGLEPWILVPQIGMVTALSPDGSTMARIDVGMRANYFVVPGSGPIAVESDIQLFLDVPRLSVGDVDGDGQTDIVTSTRHELRVFLRDRDGSFPRQANYALPLNLVTERDHIRGSGGVVTTPRDIDGDGRLDLMISHIEGGFSDSTSTTTFYYNRDGRWNLSEPDDSFVNEGALVSDLLIDLDQDNELELVRIQLKFSVFELIELMLTKEIDSLISIHRLKADGHYNAKPWVRKKFSTGISFDTFRSRGFLPSTGLDINSDGFVDMVTSSDGKGIEIFLGNAKNPFAKRTAFQRLPTAGVIRFADYNGDDLPDFVLFDPQQFGAPLRVGKNRGELPGSVRNISSQ